MTTPINPAVVQAISDQIGKEFFSAYLYLSMCGWFEAEGLPGFAKWMRVQAKEELEHGEKLFDHLVDRDARFTLPGVGTPPSSFDSVRAVVEQAGEHEAHVTASIHALYELAAEHQDWAAQTLLHWFITEQVEEERIVREVLDALALCERGQGDLMALDRELGARKEEAD